MKEFGNMNALAIDTNVGETRIFDVEEPPVPQKRMLDIDDHIDVVSYKTIGTPFVDNAKMAARNVNVYYAEKQAILDVSLDIGRNEVLAMIGPSGCGKSTFLRMLQTSELD